MKDHKEKLKKAHADHDKAVGGIVEEAINAASSVDEKRQVIADAMQADLDALTPKFHAALAALVAGK